MNDWQDSYPDTEGLYWLSRRPTLSEERTLELVEVYEEGGELLCNPIWRSVGSSPVNPIPYDTPIPSMHGLDHQEARWREVDTPSTQKVST